jgi:acetyl-CoA carboxylase carboxyl transferase subunit alpha
MAVFAAQAMVITAERLQALGLVDRVVPEPVGGAHRDPAAMAERLKAALLTAHGDIASLSIDDLLARRYQRLQSYGRFDIEAEGAAAGA